MKSLEIFYLEIKIGSDPCRDSSGNDSDKDAGLVSGSSIGLVVASVFR